MHFSDIVHIQIAVTCDILNLVSYKECNLCGDCQEPIIKGK